MWRGEVRRCVRKAVESSTYDVGGDCGVGFNSVSELVGCIWWGGDARGVGAC